MTAQKAIKYWKVFLKEIAFLKREHSSVDWEEQEQATKLAIEALKKQNAKKVLVNNENIPICPSCKAKQSGDTYCGKCGQKLKWW